MAIRTVDTDLDFSGVGKIVRALLNPVAADPGSPANGEVWFNTADSRLKVKTAAGTVSLATTADTGSGVPSSTWDAQSTVVAVSDNTPVAQVLAASTVLGRRASGDITAISYANLSSDLDILAKALYDANSVVVAVTDNTPVAQAMAASTVLGRRSTGDVTAITNANLATDLAAAGLVDKALYDAQSVLIAVTDNTPVVQALAASTVLGRRASGNVTAVTYANLLADLETLGITAADLEGSNLATVLGRAAHTGTQTAATISDFNTSVDARVALVVDSAPGALDTLNELAAALGDDANFAATVNTALGLRTRKFAANYGDAAATTFTVNHALATTDITGCTVKIISTGALIDAEVVITDANNVTVKVNTVYAANALRIVVSG